LNLLTFFLFAFILSLVPFSVALSSSVYRCIVWKEALKIALTFALFQGVMMALGWVIGFGIKGLMHEMTVPVSVIIIFIIGARMFLESRRPGLENRVMAVEDRRLLLGFAFVISINTTLLGMGLGMLYKEIMILAGLVSGMTFIMTIIGVQAGKRAMMNLGKTMELIGGAGLILICIAIILQYLKII
jgi:manganese efflux pump family protein